MSLPHCPDCRIEMEGGMPLLKSSSESNALSWLEGAPERNVIGMLKLKGRRHYPMYAWRCPNCSLVRIYAPPEPSD